MPGRINYLVPALLLLLLSGCQTVNDSLDKIGGIFTRDKASTDLIDNSNTDQSWYCYGEVRGADWDCQHQADPAKIKTIIDEALDEPVDEPVDEQATAQPNVMIPAPLQVEPLDSLASATEDVAGAATPTDATGARSPEVPEMVGGSETLLSQPGSFYTVQLIAMRDEDSIIKYARLNGLQYPLYARVLNDDGLSYVLLLGLYPDVDTAREAMNDWVRAKNLKVEPWLRQLEPLQASIRLAQQAN